MFFFFVPFSFFELELIFAFSLGCRRTGRSSDIVVCVIRVQIVESILVCWTMEPVVMVARRRYRCSTIQLFFHLQTILVVDSSILLCIVPNSSYSAEEDFTGAAKIVDELGDAPEIGVTLGTLNHLHLVDAVINLDSRYYLRIYRNQRCRYTVPTLPHCRREMTYTSLHSLGCETSLGTRTCC